MKRLMLAVLAILPLVANAKYFAGETIMVPARAWACYRAEPILYGVTILNEENGVDRAIRILGDNKQCVRLPVLGMYKVKSSLGMFRVKDYSVQVMQINFNDSSTDLYVALIDPREKNI